jgi:hypothetical protein
MSGHGVWTIRLDVMTEWADAGGMSTFLWVVLEIAIAVRAGTLIVGGLAAMRDRRLGRPGYTLGFVVFPLVAVAFVLDGLGAVAGAALAVMDEAPDATVAGVLGLVLAGFFVLPFAAELWSRIKD